MARSKDAGYVVSTNVEMRAMGEELVAVNESKGRVVVLNQSAVIILNGLKNNKSDAEITSDLERTFIIEEKESKKLAQYVKKTKGQLLDAGIILEKEKFIVPRLSIKDITTALRDTDLSRSTVSQYE